MKRLVTVLFLISIMSRSSALVAQETRGTVLGRVTDASGAVVPGVTVQATNMATSVVSTTQSNAEGNYEMPFLIPGTYRLNAEQRGFKTFVRDGIEIRIADRLTINIAMEVGAVSDQVTVTAETPLLESATASLGQVIDRRRIADLPVAHGNPFLLMTLSPGVAHTQNVGLDQPYAPTHIVGYAMDGVRANRSDITLDGAPNTALNHRWGAGDLMAGYTPPSDIVQEFKVQTATFDAAVGHSQGGVTSITLKTGGNQLHGTAYYALQDPALNSNLFFANRSGQQKAPYDYNRWGGSATGPVWIPGLYNGKERTFFSYGYEGILVDIGLDLRGRDLPGVAHSGQADLDADGLLGQVHARICDRNTERRAAAVARRCDCFKATVYRQRRDLCQRKAEELFLSRHYWPPPSKSGWVVG